MKQTYVKPQVYQVKLEPEQAVLACCVVAASNKVRADGVCGLSCDTGGSTPDASSS